MVNNEEQVVKDENVERASIQEAASTQSFFSARSTSEHNIVWKTLVTIIRRKVTATYENLCELWKRPHSVPRTIWKDPFRWQLLKSICFFIVALKLYNDLGLNLTFDIVE